MINEGVIIWIRKGIVFLKDRRKIDMFDYTMKSSVTMTEKIEHKSNCPPKRASPLQANAYEGVVECKKPHY